MNPSEPVPHPLVGETAWSLLSDAANDVSHPMRIVTLATVNAAGHAQARLMVLRGASRELSRVWFHTDEDSRKVRELKAHPRAAVVAYDPRCGLQLRLAGSAVLHTDDALAHDHWQQTNLTLRQVFGTPESQSLEQSLPFADPRLNRLWHHRDQQGAMADRRRFVVIELRIHKIEWLQVIGAKQWKFVLPTEKKLSKPPPRRKMPRNIPASDAEEGF